MKKVVTLSLLVLVIAAALWATWRTAEPESPPRSQWRDVTSDVPGESGGEAPTRTEPSTMPETMRSDAAAPGVDRSWQVQVFVCDTRGRPVGGAEVCLVELVSTSDYSPGKMAMRPFEPVARSAADGSCTLTVKTPYCAARARHVDGRVSPVAPGGAEFVDRGPLVLQLLADVFMQGVVLGDGGQPVAGAEIVQHPESPAHARRQGDVGLVQVATSDEQGRFSLSVRQGTTRSLSARSDGRTSFEREVTVPIHGDPPLVELRLRGSVVITGTVQDEHGEPAKGVTVLAHGSREPPSQAFALNGRFRVEVPGRDEYQVEAMAYGHGSSELVRVRVTPDALAPEIALQLRPMATIAGRVVDPDGRALHGAWVHTAVEDSALREPEPGAGGPRFRGDEMQHTAADGTFSLRVDPGASWTLSITGSGNLSFTSTVLEHVQPGTTGLQVVLGGIAATVRGTVVRHDGRPVGPFGVHAVVAGGAGKSSKNPPAVIDGGSFTLQTTTRSDDVRVRVVPKSADLAPWQSEPFVAAGGTIELAVTLQPWGELPVRVVDRDGWPVVHAQVHVLGAPFGVALEATDHEGRVMLRRCKPGEVQVEVWGVGAAVPSTKVQVVPGLNPELRVQLR